MKAFIIFMVGITSLLVGCFPSSQVVKTTTKTHVEEDGTIVKETIVEKKSIYSQYYGIYGYRGYFGAPRYYSPRRYYQPVYKKYEVHEKYQPKHNARRLRR